MTDLKYFGEHSSWTVFYSEILSRRRTQHFIDKNTISLKNCGLGQIFGMTFCSTDNIHRVHHFMFHIHTFCSEGLYVLTSTNSTFHKRSRKIFNIKSNFNLLDCKHFENIIYEQLSNLSHWSSCNLYLLSLFL